MAGAGPQLPIGPELDWAGALAAGAARDWFATNPRRMSGMRATGGVALIGLGGAMAFTARA